MQVTIVKKKILRYTRTFISTPKSTNTYKKGRSIFSQLSVVNPRIAGASYVFKHGMYLTYEQEELREKCKKASEEMSSLEGQDLILIEYKTEDNVQFGVLYFRSEGKVQEMPLEIDRDFLNYTTHPQVKSIMENMTINPLELLTTEL